MFRFAFAVLILLGLCNLALANTEQSVSGVAIVRKAQAMLDQKAKHQVDDLTVTPLGQVQAVAIPVKQMWELHVEEIDGDWLASRVAVPVQVIVDGKLWATRVVWFSISKPQTTMVYSGDYSRNTQGNAIRMVAEVIDVASLKANVISKSSQIIDKRLRKNVVSGKPVLESDFEEIPDISVGQVISIETVSGAARITVRGTAFSNGKIGQMVMVMASGSNENIRARVVSSQAVLVEN